MEQEGDLSEAFRETLIDLDKLRRLNDRLRAKTDGILAIVEALNEVQASAEVFGVMVNGLKPVIHFQDALLLARFAGDEQFSTVATTIPALKDISWQPQRTFQRALHSQPVLCFDTTALLEQIASILTRESALSYCNLDSVGARGPISQSKPIPF